MSRSKLVFIISALSLVVSVQVLSQEWTQWRGPKRDGIVKDFVVPKVWPEQLTKIWSVSIGAGLSSPVVKNGKVYVLTREGDEEVVVCFNLSSGERIWESSYSSPFIPNPQATNGNLFPQSRGKGPFATPVVHGKIVYTLGVDRVLSGFDAKSGKLLWRHHHFKQNIPEKLVYECPPCGCSIDGQEFSGPGKCSACGMDYGVKGLETSATMGAGNYYGAASSPLIYEGLLIVHVGNSKQGSMIAFDVDGGEQRWIWEGPAMSSSSPVLANLHGVDQIITLTRTSCVGVSARTGDLLWSFPLESNAQIVTPTVYQDLVIFSAYRSPTTAIRVERTGDQWRAKEVWNNTKITLYTSSPVLAGSTLYGLSYSNKGQFFAMDAKSGQTLWTSEGRLGEGAAILDLGNAMAALTNDGKLVLFSKGNSYDPIKTYQLSETTTWAHPVFFGENILVKDANHLTMWKVR